MCVEGRYGNELPVTPGQEACRNSGLRAAKASPISRKEIGSHGAASLATYAEYAVAPGERGRTDSELGVTFEQAAGRLAARHDCSLPFALGLPDPARGRGAQFNAGAGGTGSFC